ncbi:MAG: hypothetical protein HXX12_01610 [Geothrix sp.]|uniref:hypothetical protein n=1 Tax=Geothrix sp. TaxID=1962974 RepID=UPI0017D457E0|nr:hypothetical protein [Geothrix sp.]NWJ39649.1 hypothetical protein [Geothrix sp.]WIL22331.1 MAG: hypothetical protein QOZ81_001630 [Geothrix sp.]
MMPTGSPIDAFLQHIGPLTWDDLVTGYDFGFLTSLEIQIAAPGEGPAVQRLRALEGSALKHFEAHLWAACTEAVGKTPRPGSSRWSQAQDRWREALLREALATETTAAQLAARVERLYEQVGCPEDMLGMLKPSQAWSGTPATVDPAAVQRFLDRSRSGIRRFGAAS